MRCEWNEMHIRNFECRHIICWMDSMPSLLYNILYIKVCTYAFFFFNFVICTVEKNIHAYSQCRWCDSDGLAISNDKNCRKKQKNMLKLNSHWKGAWLKY